MSEDSEVPVDSQESEESQEEISQPKKAGVSPMTKMIAIAAVVILLIAIPMGYFMLTKDDGGEEEVSLSVTVTGKDGQEEVLDLQALEDMDLVEAVSSYQNSYGNWRGLGTYGGVELRNLADLVGGMEPGDVMTITASDDFYANLTYYQVYADEEYLSIQGQIILAYEFNGSAMDAEDLPMVAVLTPDEAFSNDDFNATCSKDPEFLSSTSAGSLWVRMVETITINELYEEWTVNLTDLEGATTVLTRTDFVRHAYFNPGEWTDSSSRTWSGATLESLLGLIDDDDPSTFNDTLADTEYQVEVMAEDGDADVFVARDLVDNDSIIANMMNGTSLGEDDTPLRLVGEGLLSGQMVSMVANITMLEPEIPEPGDVILTVVGSTTVEYTMEELQALTSYTSSGTFIKSTGTIVGPCEYTGVPLKNLVSEVYEGGEYYVEVVATDGYPMTYNYSQVESGLFEHFNEAGTSLGYGSFTLIVTYEQDGLPLEGMDLRMAIVDDSEPITSSSLWAKMVASVTVKPYYDVSVTLEGKGGETEIVDYVALEEDFEFIEAVSSYQNRFNNWRGLGTYGGVELRDLADEVGGMEPGDVMTVTAIDGYSVNLTYYQVYADDEYLSIQGQMILAYMFNGTMMDEDDRPMIAVLSPDEAFSNDDYNATCSKDPEFLAFTSASSLWVKTVARITISELYDEWNISLVDFDGVSKLLTRTEFVRLAWSHPGTWIDGYGGVWTGANLSALLGLVDDDDPTTFNEGLAGEEYEINVMASDGWNKTFVAKYLIENGAILANMFNGTALDDDDAPLRLVGANISGSQMVSMVAKITLIPPEAVALTVEGDITLEFTLSELQGLSEMTADGGFKKTTGTIEGPFEFTGVCIGDLVDMVYSGDLYSLEVEATDGYTMTYGHAQVENGTFEHYDPVTGESLGFDDFTMVVAYAQDGLPLVDMVLRIAIIDENGPITDGHNWAKYVCTLRVVPIIAEWDLELNGTTTYTMDRQTFESVASCDYHALSWSFENETGTHTYTGVALWTLVSAVDGADGPDTEYLFNDLLGFAGYDIRVTASDGYNKVFTAAQVARNDSIIVANRLDGQPLPADQWPLRIVGNWLSSSMKVGMIVNISMEDLQPVADWELNLVGTRNVTISAETFVSIYYSGLHGPWFNYTNFGGWHATYQNFTNETGDHTYAGIPLWVLIAAVDGEDLYHYEFNSSLAVAGYDVKVTASDDFSVTFSSADVAHNNSLIVAFTLDWMPLTDDEYPLKLTSSTLIGSGTVESVATIELMGLPE